MNLLFSAIASFFFLSLNAQYYYKDIITTLETNQQMNFLKTNKVQSVTATGYNPQGIKNPDFSEIQEFLPNRNAWKITTQNDSSNQTVLVNLLDKENRLISSSDTTTPLKIITSYQYDNTGKILWIANKTIDTTQLINETEEHKWQYTETGIPLKMLRIMNAHDTTEIRFSLDEKGNVIDERSYKRGVEGEMTYYYYDDNNRLTDIVRYNKKLNKLIPDYLFEYDGNNRVIQKITTFSNLNQGYLIWRYAFNENGLKTKEALFNRDKTLAGKIEYSYSFLQ